MKNIDVLAVGNVMFDIFLGVLENNVFTRINRVDHTISFSYGEKIHIENCEFLVGGNACNVAVGLGRQGFQAALCAEIGDDEFSHRIISTLLKEPIDKTLVTQVKGEKSSFSIGINFGGERTLFVEHVKRKHAFHFDLMTKWIYLTSLGVEWKEAYHHTMDYLKNHDTNLAFSPGTHQFEEEGLKTIHDMLPLSYVLFANKEEGMRIARSRLEVDDSSSVDIKKLLTTLQRFGPRIVVITDGPFGSYSIDEQGVTRFLEVFPAKIVEKTGAGDAYATGFLSAIISGFSSSDAMKWGAVNASSVIEKIGAQAGLLSKEEIARRLSKHEHFKTEEM